MSKKREDVKNAINAVNCGQDFKIAINHGVVRSMRSTCDLITLIALIKLITKY